MLGLNKANYLCCVWSVFSTVAYSDHISMMMLGVCCDNDNKIQNRDTLVNQLSLIRYFIARLPSPTAVKRERLVYRLTTGTQPNKGRVAACVCVATDLSSRAIATAKGFPFGEEIKRKRLATSWGLRTLFIRGSCIISLGNYLHPE